MIGWSAAKTRKDTEIRDDGRITVRFQNGRLLMSHDAKGFERLGPALKAKEK